MWSRLSTDTRVLRLSRRPLALALWNFLVTVELKRGERDRREETKEHGFLGSDIEAVVIRTRVQGRHSTDSSELDRLAS